MLKFEMTHKKEQNSLAMMKRTFNKVTRTIDCGSYGIKSLLMDDKQAKTSFFKEVEVWRRLNNPHVVELFGACHVSTPAFFLCEDATKAPNQRNCRSA
ncbi:hypothetical protein PR003_g7752 [Phytophthora rubi]|uniref:Protein kinase domain-containing protein n=1 Tax=Phytophthora rubi TaxID=129364 RepID=A0A6A3MIS8_9STRA|nr:hypothetical protein PR002_g9156 [Phytophthora rubi]KAE9035809.1 hypothetical protein PR001_g9150 [Phytophthora rubi]KAE9345816.1 hypothetical protein PR003_g7752 [Phytophthora rubi]